MSAVDVLAVKRRSKTQTELLADMLVEGEAWFFSDGRTYGRRKLWAAWDLRDEGLIRIEPQGETNAYRVVPADAALARVGGAK